MQEISKFANVSLETGVAKPRTIVAGNSSDENTGPRAITINGYTYHETDNDIMFTFPVFPGEVDAGTLLPGKVTLRIVENVLGFGVTLIKYSGPSGEVEGVSDENARKFYGAFEKWYNERILGVETNEKLPAAANLAAGFNEYLTL